MLGDDKAKVLHIVHYLLRHCFLHHKIRLLIYY